MLRAFKEVCKDLNSDSIGDVALSPLSLDYTKVVCPHCKTKSSFVYHGKYCRHYVSISSGKTKDELIVITRLRCISCKTTHGVLPFTAVPRSVFSVRFIAWLILDWQKHTFSSIEKLCEHYSIALHTFYRLRKCFAACVKLALGITGHLAHISHVAHILTGSDVSAANDFLATFFEQTNISFCQGRGP